MVKLAPWPPFATLGMEGCPFQGKGSATAAPCFAAPCPPLDALVASDETVQWHLGIVASLWMIHVPYAQTPLIPHPRFVVRHLAVVFARLPYNLKLQHGSGRVLLMHQSL